jgi:LPS sulfotransferase NodH
VGWQAALNRALVRTTGYQIRRAGSRRRAVGLQPGDRLVEAPAFILSPVRSGSTLLRVLLDSHSQIHSPQELHLRDMTVEIKEGYVEDALRAIGLDAGHLRYLLWDRVLHRELSESGKRIVVNKTPNDVFIVERIRECWPDARFIFLLRHPVSIARSRHELRPQDTVERNLKMVRRYCNAVERARRTYDGITVRYEELAANPVSVTQAVCAFLGVEWEAAMLDYGKVEHGRYRPGLGDWKDKIKSGRVQPAAPLPDPDEVPEALVKACRAWGYLADDAAAVPAEPTLS